MATNTLLTNDIILKEAMMHLDNNLVVSKLVNRDFQSEFGGAQKAGATIRLARPIYGVVRSGASMSAQDITEGREAFTVATQIGADLEFTSVDLTLSVDKFSERILKPQMQAIAQNLDAAVYTELANKTYNWVGTPGQTINSYTDFALAPQRLDEMAVPGKRVAILSPADHWGMAGSLTNIFSAGANGAGGDALSRGKLSTIGNVDIYMSQNVTNHTNGTWSSASVTIASASTMSVTYLTAKDTWTQDIILTGLTASTGTVAVGDVFTIANVYAVNPQGVVQSYLREFTVRTGGTASSAGVLTVTVSPPLITAAPYATVSAAAASAAAVTMKGSASTSYPQSLVFNPNACTLAVVPMIKPQGAAWCETRSYNGLNLRLIQGYDMANDKPQWRFDLLYGVNAFQPWLSTRVSGTA
jgi:hypothetical protein